MAAGDQGRLVYRDWEDEAACASQQPRNTSGPAPLDSANPSSDRETAATRSGGAGSSGVDSADALRAPGAPNHEVPWRGAGACSTPQGSVAELVDEFNCLVHEYQVQYVERFLQYQAQRGSEGGAAGERDGQPGQTWQGGACAASRTGTPAVAAPEPAPPPAADHGLAAESAPGDQGAGPRDAPAAHNDSDVGHAAPGSPRQPGAPPHTRINLDHILLLGRTLLQAERVVVGLHQRPGLVLPKGDGPSWCSRLCECLLADPPAEPLTIVDDLQASSRFSGYADVVGSASARFFCCYTLLSSDGATELGLLCLGSSRARTFDAGQAGILKHLACSVAKDLEAFWAQAAQQAQAEQMQGYMDTYRDAFLFVDTAAPGWRVLHLNQAAVDKLGMDMEAVRGHAFWDLFCAYEDTTRSRVSSAMLFDMVAAGKEFTINNAQWRHSTDSAQHRLFTMVFRPAGSAYDGEAAPGALMDARGQPDGDDSNLCYFVAIQEMLHPCMDSVATSVGTFTDAVATPFTGLELGPLLGKGGYGRVYQALYGGSIVAAKVITDTSLIRMKDDRPLEAVITAGLKNPGIVRTIAYSWLCHRDSRGLDEAAEAAESATPSPAASTAWDSANSHPRQSAREMWMLLEYCDRGCLVDAVQSGHFMQSGEGGGAPQPNMDMVLTTAEEIASGMAFLHAQGIVHGDLTGGNILLTSWPANRHGFCAKIADFGLARDLEVKSRIETKTYGTITHMPLEVLANGIISRASDTYAFGVLCWEMWTGKRAWSGMHCTQIVIAVTIRQRRLRLPSDAPAAFAELVHQCMADRPEERPNFEEVLRRLQEVKAELQSRK